MNNKTTIEVGKYHLKNYRDLGGCYLPRLILDLHNFSDDT